MSNFKGFRSGKKLPKADVYRRVNAYNRKVEEYSKLSLEELKILYLTLRGTYRDACIAVTQYKLNENRNQVASEVAKEESSNKE